MPYSSIDALPPYVKKKTKKDQQRWMAIWNHTFQETGKESAAYKKANGALNLSAADMNDPIEWLTSCVFPDWEPAGVYSVQVLRSGVWPGHPKYGDITVENSDLADAVRNFRGSSRKPFLDYNHGITSGTTPEDQEAIGWMREMWIETLNGDRLEPDEAEKSAETVLILMAEYEVNEDANERIKTKAYAFFSPTWLRTYVNEETGEVQGVTVLGGAATNIPFLNGMKGFVAIANSQAEARTMADMLPKASLCVVTEGDAPMSEVVKTLESLGYTINSAYPAPYGDGMQYQVTAGDSGDMEQRFKALEDAGFEVTSFYQGYTEMSGKPVEMAEWDTAYIDDLPDSAFAYVESGGTKDKAGKTEPRSNRHLPYKGSDGKPDAAHVRNALARLDQTDIPASAKTSAKKKLVSAAKSLGIDATEASAKSTEQTKGAGTYELVAVTAPTGPEVVRVPLAT